MMHTVSIFLLWLLGSSEEKNIGSERETNIFISVSLPTRPVSVGEDVTIICRNNCPGYVYLKPNGHFLWPGFEFRIPYVDREHGGVYTCCCRIYDNYYYYNQHKCSEPVELLITDPDLPGPSISLSPSRMAVQGSSVTIQSWPKYQNVNIYLHKTGNGLKPQAMATNGNMSVFHIRNLSLSDGGTYHCYYRLQSEFLVSNPSDPEKLWVLNPTLLKPNITLTPEVVSLGGKVTIKCQSHLRVENFYLQQPGHLKPLELPVADWTWTQFKIWKVSKEDSGSYICMYTVSRSQHPVLSLPSDPVALLLSEDTPVINAIAGVAVLVLLMGLGTFICYRKRKVERRQSTASISVEPSFRVMKVHWKAKPDSTSASETRQKKNLPPEQDTPAETEDIIYAELKQKAPHVQSEADPADDSDGCIYTTVVLH